MTAARRASGRLAPGSGRRASFAAIVIAAALAGAAAGLAACGTSGHSPHTGASAVLPEQIIAAPRSLLGASAPQSDGTIWAVAGHPSVGLFEFGSADGRQRASVSVSRSARSVAETTGGVLGIALGNATSGALQLVASTHLSAVRRTVQLPAPAIQVVTAPGSTDFYVLTAWSSSASVSVVSSGSGKVTATVPAPRDAVSLAADPQQHLVYVLQRNGLVDEIALANGHILTSFTVGQPGRSLALSPDGKTLYVLKGTSAVANIAVVDTATEGMQKVLPAPSHCLELLSSPSGRQLYEVVGSASYGNIQVFGA